MMSDAVQSKSNTLFMVAGEEIAAMFRVDFPRMTESELAQILLRLRAPELEYVRPFLEDITREELLRRRSGITSDPDYSMPS